MNHILFSRAWKPNRGLLIGLRKGYFKITQSEHLTMFANADKKSDAQKIHYDKFNEWFKDRGYTSSDILKKLNKDMPNFPFVYDRENINATHFLIGGNAMTYCLPDSAHDDFLDFYESEMIGNNIGVCENAIAGIHKFFLDLDFKNVDNDFGGEHIKYIAKVIIDLVNTWDIDDVQNEVNVALFISDVHIENNVTKSECHVIFQNIHCDTKLRQCLNERVISSLKNWEWLHCIDKSATCFRMPYSGKVRKPNDYYFLTAFDNKTKTECTRSFTLKEQLSLGSILISNNILKEGSIMARIQQPVNCTQWLDSFICEMKSKICNHLGEDIMDATILNAQEIMKKRTFQGITLDIQFTTESKAKRIVNFIISKYGISRIRESKRGTKLSLELKKNILKNSPAIAPLVAEVDVRSKI